MKSSISISTNEEEMLVIQLPEREGYPNAEGLLPFFSKERDNKQRCTHKQSILLNRRSSFTEVKIAPLAGKPTSSSVLLLQLMEELESLSDFHWCACSIPS